MLQQTPVEFRGAASPALLERGCVNVIALDALRQQAGSRWARIRDGVYARMEMLLRQKLGPTDFFARINENAYLVTMPSTDPEDVNVVCLRVAHDLYTSFLGQCDIGNIHVSTASDAGENTLALHPLPIERLAVLAEKAGIQDFNLPQHLRKTGLDGDLSSPADRSVISSGDAALPTPTASSLIVEHHYVPVWSVPSGVITTYVCEPKSITTAQVPQRYLTPAQLTAKERAHVELSCLRVGVAQLAKQLRRGDRFLLGVMVSFDVLGSPAGRMELLSTCHDLSSEYRQYIEFTLTGVPHGVAQTRLNDLANTLRPFARGVSATVAPGSRDFIAYGGIGLRAIGIAKREFANRQDFQHEDLAHLANAAKLMKLGTFVADVKNIGTLKPAYNANIQQLSGPAIAPVCDEPHGMYRLTWEDVLSYRFLA